MIRRRAPLGRGIWGWMFFDWAAQPFFTVVTTFIFGPYFVSRMAPNPADGQAAWGYAIAVAGLFIAVLSPVLGSIADQTGGRKPWIAGFAVLQIVSMSLLWFAAPGSPLLPVLLFFSLASVASEFSIVFNDSMMPRLLAEREVGRVSNLAWGLGYVGGMIVLIFVVIFIAGSPATGKTILGLHPLFGLDPAKGEDARIVGPLAAIWYLLFILPMFVFTPDAERGLPVRKAVGKGLRELAATLREVRQKSGLFRFLVARMIYQDGVNALLVLGGAFAAQMFGWTITEIGLYGIILNVVAIFGCFAASRLDQRLGSKSIVILALFFLSAATLGMISTGPGYALFGLIDLGMARSGALFGTMAEKAYILFGLLVGLAFGPVQASSRSWLARSVSAGEAGRYFGIYALAGRATSFAAPLAVAGLTQFSGSPRLGMAAIVLFLAGGLALLLPVPYPAAKPGK
ncbi:MAG: MFS transporter [Rhizobiaceae bacterium]|nr:MAG: MFS transporter [Rhizobiaceae bacterium]